MELLIELWRGLALGMMGKIDEALRTFGHVQSQSSDPGVIDEVAVACGRLSTQLRREERWLESGRCAKFLFENLKTPLIETHHMFNLYGNRLRDAALFEEEFQAANRLVAVTAKRDKDQTSLRECRWRAFQAGLAAGHIDAARAIAEDFEKQALALGDEALELRSLGSRVFIDLASGKYDRALERVGKLIGTDREERPIGDSRWGQTAADLRATALVLLGRRDEPLEDLDAGRISTDLLDLRFILGAELWKSGHEAAARACFAEMIEGGGLWRQEKLMDRAKLAICREMPIEVFQEFVGAELQPCLQPLGMFLAGLAMWANGEEQAALLAWSDARNAAPDTDPAWHWTSLFLGRAGK